MNPKKMLCGMVIKPADGVMTTKPTTAPIQAPSAETFLPFSLSKNTHVIMADAEAMVVVANAMGIEIDAADIEIGGQR